MPSVTTEYQTASRSVKYAQTPFGEIAYTEKGTGPAAVFLHGIFLSGYLWRHVIDQVADLRRCIAIDLLAHGATRTATGQDLSFESQTEMLAAFCDALGLDRIDLVGNDSGGGIAQIFATRYQHRLRSLTLTNCDTHDNCPPEALQPLMDAVAQGQIGEIGRTMLADPNFARGLLASGYQFPERLSDETIRIYLEPLFATRERTELFEQLFKRCFLSLECRQTFVLDTLNTVQTPTSIVWGNGDLFFDVKWAHWLYDTIPGAQELVLLDDATLFFPEERPGELADVLRRQWGRAAERQR